MLTSRSFLITDESQVGETRRALAEECQHRAINQTDAGKLAIVVTELGRNLVRHAGGGELIIREISARESFGFEILAIDNGPGIANLQEAFRDGYSTGGTSGHGIGSVRRLSHVFDIFSRPGKGTIVLSSIGGEPSHGKFEIGAVSIPVAGESLCGDAWHYIEGSHTLRLAVADGLGHGPFAEEAAREAMTVFRAHPAASIAHTLEFIHLALSKTRGAAGAIVHIDLSRRQLSSAGIGNISTRLILDESSKTLVTDNGTLGANVRKVHDAVLSWDSSSIIVMHSDGIASRWNLGEYPGILHRHPSIIAALLYRDHRREKDDSTVVVLRERK